MAGKGRVAEEKTEVVGKAGRDKEEVKIVAVARIGKVRVEERIEAVGKADRDKVVKVEGVKTGKDKVEVEKTEAVVKIGTVTTGIVIIAVDSAIRAEISAREESSGI